MIHENASFRKTEMKHHREVKLTNENKRIKGLSQECGNKCLANGKKKKQQKTNKNKNALVPTSNKQPQVTSQLALTTGSRAEATHSCSTEAPPTSAVPARAPTAAAHAASKATAAEAPGAEEEEAMGP